MSCLADQGRHWFAFRIKPQHERAVLHALQARDLEPYLPLYHTQRRWSDRVKEVALPLFGGYLFCRMEIGQRARVLSVPGVRAMVAFGNIPAAIPDIQIEVVRQMETAGLPMMPWPFLEAGQRVQIQGGPLDGLEGTLAANPDSWRVVVNVELLHRGVAVTVERGQIFPLQTEQRLAQRSVGAG
ncbi:MAG: hypothetical protein JJE04_05935 [Acidobacteriia bacterium]|nr:hypothetical protein [Terriglobia bacterium]